MSRDEVHMEPKWLVWAREIQATAQTGLAFTKDIYDQQRYERLRELAADIMAEAGGANAEIIKDSSPDRLATQHQMSMCVLRCSKTTKYFWFKGAAMPADGRFPADG